MPSRASVSSQVLPQPLILAANSTNSMSRQSSGSSKRDSAIGIAVSGFERVVQRTSLKRGLRRESDSDMAPVYRLSVHSSAGNILRRRLGPPACACRHRAASQRHYTQTGHRE
ncbi:hypothetical protein CLAFUW4_00418 [Fulvia fulva]|uniref:Uncharacterized protein n=1 Tax=Passalora fulva TaxID=5499 RepID=A0A9Q8P3D4_PASFU|nr:uncharacterized protein CLAFUR5_00420 [Fulvia fulva]KAK4635154.1 hypothetical protein CLAFUR4_00418 [Fulvia fulva]KAK4638356.1 hypothetical protein CLAFUR0_00419 [Fulvia fulva]UJO11910.1 hypothetical protein CLAFUR5_00420 [Fulvia fulva]WPV09902.1 hypothetical protein CLAFUW4_00418 [Fulvia fulva]WPV23531.1 hypothetical protein CLAFUW7_00422 [Fulvia fulva]